MANNQIALLAQAPVLDTPFESQGKALQLRQLMNQGQSADLEMQQKRQAIADDAATRNVFSTISDPSERIAALYKVSPKAAISMEESQQKARKSTADIGHTEAQTKEIANKIAAKQIDAIGQTIGSLTQIKGGATPQHVATALQHLVDVGMIQPEMAQKITAGMPQDPSKMQEWLGQGQSAIMSAKDQLAQTTPDANAQLVAETARLGQASTAANAAAVDARTRDFNATKVEENRLKREIKQETVNMTKAGQVASFDTMLGTLDRLKQHPGLPNSVGIVGKFPTMPGSDSANFQAELNTFQSQAFVPMVAQLKGMGALSDAEGKKLTMAVGALDPKMGEQAFRESIDRIIVDMDAARKRVAGGGKPAGKTVTRTGVSNGRKVVQYSDGSVEYAD